MCYQWKPSVAPFLAWCSCGHMNVTHDVEGRCFFCELLPLMPWADATPKKVIAEPRRRNLEYTEFADQGEDATLFNLPPTRLTPSNQKRAQTASRTAHRRAWRRRGVTTSGYHYHPRFKSIEEAIAKAQSQLEANQRTIIGADRRFARWTDWEIEIALDPAFSAEEAALGLGRTYKGVTNARNRFRQDREAALAEGRHTARQINHGKATS